MSIAFGFEILMLLWLFNYLFEIKAVDKPTGNALKQIKEREYYLKYQGSEKVFGIGMEFCKEQRNLCLFEWEEY